MNPTRTARLARGPRRLVPLALAGALVLAACGDDDESTATEPAADTASPTTAAATAATAPAATTAPASTAAPSDTSGGTGATAAERYTTDLTGVCPERVAVQTNWWPQPDHALFYQLIGPGGEVDASNNVYSGPLGSTGVELEIRAGGPALGFQPVESLLAQDEDLLLGLVGTDAQISGSATAPTVGVLAWYQRSPQVLLWGNPEWDFETIEDIGASGVTVLAFEGAPYLEVFTGQGWLNPDQIDTSYQGGPARFVAEDGNIVQQGFVTSEPYLLESENPEWGKPVEYLLVDPQYPVYQNTVVARPETIEGESDCLAALVPLLQQAAVDYIADPEPVNGLLVDYVAQIDGGGFTLSAGKAAYAVATQVELGIVANGPDGVFGTFDVDKLQTSIDQLAPVFEGRGVELKDGLTAADLYTDEFLDPSISL